MNRDPSTFTAEEAWERLCIKVTGEILTAEGWVGAFNGQSGFMYFGCGDACCDDFWRSRESFLQMHKDTIFTNE